MDREETLLELLQSHGDALHRIARAHAGPGGEEEDLYQEIVMQAWRSLPDFRGESSPSTWLYRVALNTALTWRRRITRAASRIRLDAEGEDVGTGAGGTYPARAASARTVSARSQAAILEEFLSSLDGPDHTVLILYMEGLAYREIAEVTGLSESAVGVRLHRMKKAFTERYVEG